MSPRTDFIRQTILADHAASMSIFQRFTPEQWEQPAPSDEGALWKARDVLAHLAVSESGQLGQLTRSVKGEVTLPDDFDLTRFNRRSVQKQAGKPVTDLLQDIETAHAQVLATLDAVSDADLDKTGRHASGQMFSVETFFRYITQHRLRHAEELQRFLGA